MKSGRFQRHTFVRLALVLMVFANADFFVAAEGCSRVLSIGDVRRIARRVEGKVVCVRGVIAVNSEDQSQFTAFIEELTSLEQVRQGVQQADAVGLVDWDEESGISGDLYKPDSFDLIEETVKERPEGLKGRYLLDVTLRGAVMYKRRLQKTARETAAQILGADPFKSPQRDVELVLLELVKVNGVLPDRSLLPDNRSKHKRR